MGGISGYFGGWVDNLIMRIVDVFYCIPSTPILIILGAAMDAMSVDPKIRMVYLMLILGFLGWPGMARLVRGQILSLREQEFMTATEATGLSVSRRIFKHLVPNVIPQLIVSCTMGLGSTIITEATLSFLGLGVKYPFASWGNIISDVTTTHVLTSYWFVWIPAGILLLVTVLAFNLVGDGLRDAFDPKMKR
jgi:peptide/nickel transport system permease protein